MDLKIYSIDLTLTNDCNFRCSYCFENYNKKYYEDYDFFITKMDELLESSFFIKNYQFLNIGFWGGEPTLHPKAIREIINYFGKDDRVRFFIYSNGYDLSNIIDILLEYKDISFNGVPKIIQQISYDGIPIHDLYRKSKDGSKTSKKVKNTILNLMNLEIPFTIKSTVTPNTFKFMYEVYSEFQNINEQNKNNSLKGTLYFPTIDYYHIENYSYEDLEKMYLELEESLLKIVQDEIKYFKEKKKFAFAWFKQSRNFCTSGRDMIAIDVDNNIYPCHGCLYIPEKEQHFVGSLNDIKFIQYLKEVNEKHSLNFFDQPNECKECKTSYCLKCNVVKFKNSKKIDYMKKWNDYTSQPKLCFLYKKIGDFSLAFREYIKEEI